MTTSKNKSTRSKTREKNGLRALYAKYRKKFGAADLQKYTDLEEGIPLEQVIADMEKIQRQEESKR